MDPTESVADSRDDGDTIPSITVSRGVLPDSWLPESWRRKRNKRKHPSST